jgi:hypothetical protein
MQKPTVIVNGKSYPLFKRGKLKESPWWVRVQHNGRRVGVSTHTADSAQAQVIAEGIVRRVMGAEWQAVEQMREPRRKVATVGQILGLLSEDSGRRLLEMVKVGGSRRPEAQPTSIINGTLASAWLAHCQGLARPDYELPGEWGGANAVLRHVKSAFGPKMMATYRRHGLEVQEPRGLAEVQELPEPRFRYSDRPLTDKQVAQVVRAGPRIKKEQAGLWRDAVGLVLKGQAVKDRQALGRWLSAFGITVDQWRWHRGAVWLKRTGSLKLVAEKMGVSYAWALWHFGELRQDVELKLEDL